MMRLTRRLRLVLGFCLLALGSLGVNSAQAVTWMVNGSDLSGKLAVRSSLVAPSATLTTKIGGNSVKFTCTNAELIAANLDNEGKLAEGARTRFTGCTTAINGATQKVCLPNNESIEPGVILTNKLKGQLKEHSTGEGVVVVESTVKEKVEGKEVPVFGHVKMSAECTIGEDVPIIGPKLALVDAQGMGTTGGTEGLLHEQATHKVKEGPLTEIWAISETAEHKATIGGEASLELLAGEPWNGLLAAPVSEPPVWMVQGVDLSSGSKSLKAAAAAAGLTLTTKIGGNEVKFICKKAALKSLSLEKKGGISQGTIRYEECTTAINGTTQKSCEPILGAEHGVVVSEEIKGALSKHSTGEGVTLMEPLVKQKIEGKEVPVFGHVLMGEECSIGEDVPIIGPKLALVDAQGMGTTGGTEGLLHEQATHKVKEGPLTEIWAISETAEHKATISGELEVGLASSEKWSGLLPVSVSEPPVWMVQGVDLSSGSESLKAAAAAAGLTLTTKIGGNEVKFICKKAALKSLSLEKKGGISQGTIRYEECTTAINGTTQKSCEPILGAEHGVVVSEEIKGALSKHSTGEGVTLMEPLVKQKIEGKEVPVFGHVLMGEECSIGEDVPIIGPKLALVDAQGMGTTGGTEGLLHEQATHKVKEGPLTEIWAISETAEHKATISGELEVGLASSEKWSGLLP